MIDNLNAVYQALHDLPEGLEAPTNLLEGLSEHGTNFTRLASVERLTKATMYQYTFIRNGFGISLHVRTMNGPFSLQRFMLRVGSKRYPCVVVGSEVTLKDYTHADKVEVEELLSKLSRLITDITLNYKDEV